MGDRLRVVWVPEGEAWVVGSLAEKMLAEAAARDAALAASAPPCESQASTGGGSLALKMLQSVHGPDYRPHPNSRDAHAVYENGPCDSPELRRIIALPKKEGVAPDLTEEFLLAAKCELGCPLCAPRPKNPCSPGCPRCEAGEAHLWPLQSEALHWARIADGLFGALGVGSGKTLVSLLLPQAMSSKQAVLLVPPQLRDQLKKMIGLYARHWRLPAIRFGRGGALDGLRVFGYSEISVQSGADALEDADPDLVIADESHNLKAKTAARTRRFLRLFRSRPRRFVALSGSPTTSSIKNYAHLLGLVLRKNTPLPRPWPELDDWSRALDVNVEEERRMKPGALVLLGAKSDSIDDVRAAYRERLISTPGVISSAAGVLSMSLNLRAVRPKMSGAMEEAIAQLELTWTRPDGEEMESPLAMAMLLRQLCFGFYYVWDWPGGVPDHEWMSARAEWHKEQREYLKRNNRPGMDSPGFLAAAAESGRWASQTWARWSLVKDRYVPHPPTKTVWVDRDFASQVARSWLPAEGGVIWYEHKSIGEEVARALDLPLFDGGTDAALANTTPAKTPIIVCSIKSHGTGKELQAWSNALILGAISNGTAYEQLLGRLHRDGQEADEVEYVIPLHHESLDSALDAAIKGARYKEATLEGRQKLLYANIIR